MPGAVLVYAFADRRENGAFPVYEFAGGTLAATVSPAFWTRSFSASLPDGQPLCAGRATPMTRTVDVSDGAGQHLFTMRSVMFSGKQRSIELVGGAVLHLQGERWPSRDWEVTDAAGRIVLGIAATASSWSFHPDAYAVQVSDPGLTLAHVVGIVQANRMLVKAARSSDGAAG